MGLGTDVDTVTVPVPTLVLVARPEVIPEATARRLLSRTRMGTSARLAATSEPAVTR